MVRNDQHGPLGRDRADPVTLEPEPPRNATVFEGEESAKLSLQALGFGVADMEPKTVDVGIMDMQITPPAYPGDTASVRYIRDPQQRTTSSR